MTPSILDPGDNVEIRITGSVKHVPFEGKDYIRVIAPPGYKGKKAKIIHLGMNRGGGHGDIIILFSPILWLLIWRIIRRFGLRSFQLRALLSTSALVVLVVGGLAACGDVLNISLGDGYFYHNDHLETPLAVTDAEGNLVWSVDFDPFMEIYLENNPNEIIQNFRFPGQYYDAETGLHYNMHRYYNPSTGRYITPDPIAQLMILPGNIGSSLPSEELAFIKPKTLAELQQSNRSFTVPLIIETPRLLSLYPYVTNNPINFADITGLIECEPGEEKVWDSGKMWACLGKENKILDISVLAAACVVAIEVPMPPIAKIPAIVGACGFPVALVTDCIVKAYECKKIKVCGEK